MIYVVGNEQNYHFQVLSILLDRLGFEWGKSLVHFSYGMVELPEGKMKSREGTVVDADDLMEEMINTAKETSGELGKLDGLTQAEADDIARIVGLGALKYFIRCPQEHDVQPQGIHRLQWQYRSFHPIYLRPHPVRPAQGGRSRHCYPRTASFGH